MIDYWLKPCPFCGATPSGIKNHSGDYGYTPDTASIGCETCKFILHTEVREAYNWEKREHYRRDEEAYRILAEKWNTRSGS